MKSENKTALTSCFFLQTLCIRSKVGFIELSVIVVQGKYYNYFDTQEPQLSSKSEIKDSRTMPRTQRTVAGMATRKQSRNAAPYRGHRELSLAWQRVNNHGTQRHTAEADNCDNEKAVKLEKI